MSQSRIWDFGRSKSGSRSAAHTGGASGVERLDPSTRAGRRWIAIALWLSVVTALATVEIRTSWLQSLLLTELDRQLTYRVEHGAGPVLHAPLGPYDKRLGYSSLPDYVSRLSARGFKVIAHARVSRLFSALTTLGIPLVYHEKTQAGLSILDRHDEPLFTGRYPNRVYRRFEEIPPLVLRTLLFIENRELLEPARTSRNPAIEWDRLAGAAFDLGLHAVDPKHPVSGGSTLVTQLEKLRHSPGGRTASVAEKGHQLIAASLTAYLDGINTTAVRVVPSVMVKIARKDDLCAGSSCGATLATPRPGATQTKATMASTAIRDTQDGICISTRPSKPTSPMILPFATILKEKVVRFGFSNWPGAIGK